MNGSKMTPQRRTIKRLSWCVCGCRDIGFVSFLSTRSLVGCFSLVWLKLPRIRATRLRRIYQCVSLWLWADVKWHVTFQKYHDVLGVYVIIMTPPVLMLEINCELDVTQLNESDSHLAAYLGAFICTFGHIIKTSNSQKKVLYLEF